MMRKLLLDKWFAVILCGLVVISSSACTSSAADEEANLETDAADAADVANADAAASDEAANETMAEENAIGNPIEDGTEEEKVDSADLSEKEPTDTADTEKEAEAELEPSPENAPPAATAQAAPPAPVEPPQNTAAQIPAPAPIPAADTTGRLVRYIKADNTKMHAEASATSATVGQLHQGTSVVVSINNGWAEIAPGHFIEAANLSEALVAKKKTDATWIAP